MDNEEDEGEVAGKTVASARRSHAATGGDGSGLLAQHKDGEIPQLLPLRDESLVNRGQTGLIGRQTFCLCAQVFRASQPFAAWFAGRMNQYELWVGGLAASVYFVH